MTCPLFHDKKLDIYDGYVVIKDYHAPGLDKTIPTADIESARVVGLTGLRGKWRLWGTGTFRRWYPFHQGRHAQENAVVIRRKTGLIKEVTVSLESSDLGTACRLLNDLRR